MSHRDSDRVCEHCVNWVRRGDVGECRKGLPTAGVQGLRVWPLTLPEDWCGHQVQRSIEFKITCESRFVPVNEKP